jgi:hypothetical protein
MAIEIGKGFRAGQARKRSIEAIGPGMVGANEVPSPAHFSLLRYEPCPAVAADVKEHPQHSIRAPGHQQGHAAKVDREDRTGFSELVNVAKAQWQAAKQMFVLGFKTPHVVINLWFERVRLDFPVRTGGLVKLID